MRPFRWRGAAAGLAGVVILATSTALVVASLAGRSSHGPDGSAAHRSAPFSLSALSPEVAGHYRFARAHLEEFEQIPCWCGCEQFLAHRHLSDCFVQPGGGWEPHAAGCGVCNAEAVVAERMLGEGGTPAGIKAAVDVEFGPTAITTPSAMT